MSIIYIKNSQISVYITKSMIDYKLGEFAPPIYFFNLQILQINNQIWYFKIIIYDIYQNTSLYKFE
jgi:hypothetical protein